MMSLHKLTAGTGYDYLTRQVAAMDSTTKGHTSLGDYYEQKGESSGRWVGSGLAGIDGVQPGDVVTAEQMWRLFGLGDHPVARQRLEALTAGATKRDFRDAVKFGQKSGIYRTENALPAEVARRISAWNASHGHEAAAPVPAEVRATIRTEVGREHFHERFGRDPLDARELSGFIVLESRPAQSGVAGYDLTSRR